VVVVASTAMGAQATEEAATVVLKAKVAAETAEVLVKAVGVAAVAQKVGARAVTLVEDRVAEVAVKEEAAVVETVASAAWAVATGEEKQSLWAVGGYEALQ
jgi:hypothetical protein